MKTIYSLIFDLGGATMGDSRINLRQRARRYFIRASKWLVGSIYLLIGAPGYKSKLIAFVFHEIGNSPREHPRLTGTYSSEKTFLKQIEILKNNFRIVDPLELTSEENPYGCLITFDDGYEGSLSAARLLEKDGISSLHFVNLDTIYGTLNSSATVQSLNLGSSENVRWTDSNPKTFENLTSRLTQIQLDELSNFSGPYLTVNQLNELMSMRTTSIGDHFLNHCKYSLSVFDLVITQKLTHLGRYFGRIIFFLVIRLIQSAPLKTFHFTLNIGKNA